MRYKYYYFLNRENIGGHLISQVDIFNAKITLFGSFEPVARQGDEYCFLEVLNCYFLSCSICR